MTAKTFLSIFLLLSVSTAVAALEPSRVRDALAKKTASYVSDGVVTGGDREVRGGIVKNLRRATNTGFERIVLDVDSEKPPYFQAAIEPSEKRIVVTLFGNPHIGLDAKKIVDQFKKSPHVRKVELFPKIEEETFIFALHLRNPVPVEVFQLSAPSRIILDLKNSSGAKTAAVAKPKVRPEFQEEVAPPVATEPEDGNGASRYLDDIPE